MTEKYHFDPLRIRLYLGIFRSICEEMGNHLQRSGFSPNIKERRDFSCALFDGKGELLAQAAHIPVHLGSCQKSVQFAMEKIKMSPGDMVILNDPFQGGTHLPDLTLIAPVFLQNESTSSTPSFFLVNRAHHADIGGTAPGSLPLSSHINDEGFCFGPTLLMERHQINEDFFKKITQSSRTPKERNGDLLAQIAANKLGQRRVHEMVKRYGIKALKRQARELQNYAEAMMAQQILMIPDGTYEFEDYLEAPHLEEKESDDEDLIRLSVKVTIQGRQATVDFSGSAKQNRSSLNTVFSVTQSAVLYVFRAISLEDFPVNSGCLKPLKILAPKGCILNAQFPAAVSAGNVETSQRIVDLLLGTLSKPLPGRIPAASCGSMNNICIGGKTSLTDEPFSYYETIAGGQGAAAGISGSDAIQTHMTNTLNTPIEALEHAYPFRIETYRIRPNSGGDGQFPGGNGMERSYRLLQNAYVTVISERRLYPPYGLQGGGDGLMGENILERNGIKEALPGKFSILAQKGDLFRILTPGGGGYGKKN